MPPPGPVKGPDGGIPHVFTGIVSSEPTLSICIGIKKA